jgi:hypothetical protein
MWRQQTMQVDEIAARPGTVDSRRFVLVYLNYYHTAGADSLLEAGLLVTVQVDH